MCGFDRLAGALVLLMAGKGAAQAEPPPSPTPPPVRAPVASTPVPIGVPTALARQSATLEPSGIAWSQTLDRYLIVSDDTGGENDHHQPWILAMSRDGVFDAAVVPLLGIDSLNDAESICAGPDGTFFIATSHSANKKGHTPPARRMLLLTRVEGRALRVVGHVDLTTARNAAGGGLLDIGRLPPEGRLDIEAMTFRDGALLIGLKSPLSAHDTAVVLRLDSPVQAVKAGMIPVGAVTRLWDLSLVGGGPGDVPRGIADLTTLRDGSLVVVANSPKGRKSDRGGAVFWLRPGTAPRLLQWFEDLRPEGATLAADGKSLLVVFDNHERPPLWTHLALPAEGAATP